MQSHISNTITLLRMSLETEIGIPLFTLTIQIQRGLQSLRLVTVGVSLTIPKKIKAILPGRSLWNRTSLTRETQILREIYSWAGFRSESSLVKNVQHLHLCSALVFLPKHNLIAQSQVVIRKMNGWASSSTTENIALQNDSILAFRRMQWHHYQRHHRQLPRHVRRTTCV